MSKRTRKPKQREPKQPPLEAEYSPEFRQIVASGIWGIITPLGLNATVFSERLIVDDVAKSPKLETNKLRVKRIVEFDMIINPLQMKAIHTWLGTKISEYEHIFGEIRTQKELSNRAKTLPPVKKI